MRFGQTEFYALAFGKVAISSKDSVSSLLECIEQAPSHYRHKSFGFQSLGWLYLQH
jgi:hypothetical protein